jgi:hypothetical protein
MVSSRGCGRDVARSIEKPDVKNKINGTKMDYLILINLKPVGCIKRPQLCVPQYSCAIDVSDAVPEAGAPMAPKVPRLFLGSVQVLESLRSGFCKWLKC